MVDYSIFGAKTAYGRALRQARKARNLSITEAATLVGLRQDKYSAYERGKRIPSFRNKVRIEESLGVRYDDYKEQPKIRDLLYPDEKRIYDGIEDDADGGE